MSARLAALVILAAGASPMHAADCRVDKAGYEALRTGMSYAEAVGVLGCAGEEISSSEMAGYKTVMFMWTGDGLGANMNAMFQNDELVTKAQFGLK